MLNGLLKKFGFPFLHLGRQRDGVAMQALQHRAYSPAGTDEFLRKLSDKDREVKENDSSSYPCYPRDSKLLDIWNEMR